MTLTEHACATAGRIIAANAGAYPITIDQLVRAASSLGITVRTGDLSTSPHGAGDTIVLPRRSSEARTLAAGIHELAERTAQHPDPNVRHSIAMRLEAHYLATIGRIPITDLQRPPWPAPPVVCPLATDAPDQFDDEHRPAASSRTARGARRAMPADLPKLVPRRL